MARLLLQRCSSINKHVYQLLPILILRVLILGLQYWLPPTGQPPWQDPTTPLLKDRCETFVVTSCDVGSLLLFIVQHYRWLESLGFTLVVKRLWRLINPFLDTGSHTHSVVK